MKTINIFGAVGDAFDGVTVDDVAAQLEGCNGPPDVIINSPGGLADAGFAIYNLLAPYEPMVRIVGLAASAASVIAMAGKRIEMAKGSRMMIHEAWGLSVGPASAHRAEADVLEKYNASLAEIYVDRTGKSVEEVRSIMAADTWYTATEAIESGFATHLDGQEAAPDPPGTDEMLAAIKGQPNSTLTNAQKFMWRKRLSSLGVVQ